MKLLTIFQSVLINNSFLKGMLSFFVMLFMMFYNLKAQETKFDFGSSTSPLATSCIRVHTTSVYSTAVGYGFSTTSGLESRDRGGENLARDFVFKKNNNPSGTDANWEFKVDVRNGTYEVTVYAGDLSASQARYDYSVEGISTSIVANSGIVSSNTLTVVVTDGQINLITSGTQETKRINGLDIKPVTYTFDFGTSSSPVNTGDLQVSPSTSAYSNTQGYGFTNTSGLDSRDRLSGNNVNRDFVFKKNNDPSGTGSDWEFNVDLPSGTYEVTLYSGDAFATQSTYNYTVEGTSTSINAASGTIAENSTTVMVSDGVLNIATTGGSSTKRINRLKVSAVDVIAIVSGNQVTFDNKSIEAIISGGKMTSLNVKNQSNLLDNGGYGYFSYVDNDGFYSPTNLTPQVKINTSEIADIYFEHSNNFIIEMHYVFKKNESGFYTYYVVSDNGLPSKNLEQLRFGVRVDKDIFDYAWTVEREGDMIHPDVLANNVEEIQDATYKLQDSSIYTKYDWAVDRYSDTHHGLLGNGVGIWNIEASREYINGGPSMQDNTVHGTETTPILLTTFKTLHFGNTEISLQAEYTTFNKLWGPAFIYINSGTNQEIIADAASKALEKQGQWPYTWLNHALYPLNRGTFTGTLDMNGGGDVENARVFLSKEGPSWYGVNEHWQQMPYDYFFMTEADSIGNFTIENIIPGTYDLYAYTQQGKLIDELKHEDVVVNSGVNSGGTIVWDAGDKEEIIFQIGAADHKSGEYKLGDLPRNYGRWFDSPLTLSYDTATDNPRDDWYYCQQESSEWDILFSIDSTAVLIDPTLKVAIAGSDAGPHLDIWVNGQKINSTSLGSDSGIRRSSLTAGKYSLLTLPIDKSLLIDGINTITLECVGSESPYKGIMYDAVLLEADINDENDNYASKKGLVSKSETEFPDALVYPNPSTGQFNLTIDADYDQEISITTRSLAGVILDKKSVPVNKGHNRLIQNLSMLSKGLYLITIQVNASIIQAKIYIN